MPFRHHSPLLYRFPVVFHMKMRRSAAFTLVELLVAACLSSVVGLIVYGIASEGLVDFARNVSINRSYSNGRQAVDKIAVTMRSAGHTPVMINASGADITPTPTYNPTSPTYQAGIRFWRNSAAPVYYITTPAAITATALTLSLIQPGTTSTVLPAPLVGDMITVAALGFQAQATSVTTISNSATVTFSGTIASNSNANLTASSLTAITTQISCLDWVPVAFIDINNQLRYYPRFISGTTNVNTPANYQVLTYLTATLGTANTPLPFSFGPTPSINVDLYAEAPDYNNRTAVAGTNNGYTGLSTADTYTYIQTALSTRNPVILRSPY